MEGAPPVSTPEEVNASYPDNQVDGRNLGCLPSEPQLLHIRRISRVYTLICRLPFSSLLENIAALAHSWINSGKFPSTANL